MSMYGEQIKKRREERQRSKYGLLIKICRSRAQLTQVELAEKANIGQCQLSSYETGRVIPRADVLDDLIRACGYEFGIRDMC